MRSQCQPFWRSFYGKWIVETAPHRVDCMLDLIAALSALARQVLLPIEATVPAILAFDKSGWLGAFVVAAVIKPKGGYYNKPELPFFATDAIESDSLKGMVTPSQENDTRRAGLYNSNSNYECSSALSGRMLLLVSLRVRSRGTNKFGLLIWET